MEVVREIIHRPVGNLVPYAANARLHSDEQVAGIVASIREFGFNNPVLIDGEGGLIAGHGRILAARALGMTEVPTIELGHLSEAQKRAFILADNQLALNASWDEDLLAQELQALDGLDFDLSLTGFDTAALEDFLFDDDAHEGLTDDDAVPEVGDEPVNRVGDLWRLGRHRMVCGDCTDSVRVEALLQGIKIDLIVSDPPYGVDLGGKNKKLSKNDNYDRIQNDIVGDNLTPDETKALWVAVFSVWYTYLADNSSYYITSPPGAELMLRMIKAMQGNKFPVRQTIIWNKSNHVLGRSDYNYKHEPLLYGWSKRHKFYGNGEFKSSVWDIPKPQKSELHPTMKPVALIQECILNSSHNNQIVADMFLGSGTALIAAEKTGRICYGMEISPHYADVCVKRWQEFAGLDAVRESDGRTFTELETEQLAA